jgi:hypothetical protein
MGKNQSISIYHAQLLKTLWKNKEKHHDISVNPMLIDPLSVPKDIV